MITPSYTSGLFLPMSELGCPQMSSISGKPKYFVCVCFFSQHLSGFPFILSSGTSLLCIPHRATTPHGQVLDKPLCTKVRSPSRAARDRGHRQGRRPPHCSLFTLNQEGAAKLMPDLFLTFILKFLEIHSRMQTNYTESPMYS